MELSRRVFLESSLLGSAALGTGRKDGSPQPGVSVAGAQTRQVPGPPAYGIIYNWDGAPHDYSEYPQSLEQFLEKTYAPMKDTQVGAHFWCIGEHEAKWRSTALEMIGDPQNRVYESVRDMRHSEGIRAMLERGENPYEALVKRGHELGMAVYASVRMNDNHFNGLQLQDVPKTVMPGLTRLRKEHPEWCLGAEHAPAWFAASWNFAVPEVREHRLQHITEVCRLADWDGVELDWQRHPFHLPADHAYRLRYTLTDLQRAVRQLTDRIARERGRPFYVAVRVATTMESCRRIGYDLPVWINERLCDIVTAGGGAGTDPGIEVEAFVDLLKAGSIQFYTGFDGGLWGDHMGLMTDREWYRAWVRGVANGYWDRGCSGMYVFNWHANEKTRRDLLTTIGRPETLKRTNKVYNTLYRHIAPKGSEWAGADLNDRIYGETPVSLYRTLTGNGPNFHLHVHDDVASESRSGSIQRLELHLELEHLSKADKVEVLLDGRALQGPQVRNVKGENPDDPADVDENSWLVWSLTPERIERGPHLVQVRLLERDLRIRPSLVVRHVEVHVDYKA